jgi:MFS superfamily sulfate permease-like transporter
MLRRTYAANKNTDQGRCCVQDEGGGLAVPSDWLKGLKENWREDLISSFSVALVAMPLGLGIAIASDVPPVAGLLSAAIGGIVTTLVRGSHIAINGPAAGLIVVVAHAVSTLGGDGQNPLPFVTAAIVVAGIIQVLLGLLRMGSFGNFFPASVIHGLLAAIGVIIFGKQFHVAMGETAHGESSLDQLLSIPTSIYNFNPAISTIALASVIVLFVYPRIKNKTIKFLPAPIWVLIACIPLVYAFNLFEDHSVTLLGKTDVVGPDYLVDLPENLSSSLFLPDFSKIGEPAFWATVFAICLVATIETLLSTKAVDKLDPYKRKTDLNKDLIGVGVSTIASGCLGGLPIITVIVRSTVNVTNGGRTRWANFYHGVIILAFVLLLPGLIEQVPLAALAGILMFTGAKLASPKVFRDGLKQGNEQFAALLVTLFVTLEFGLLEGLAVGICFILFIHWIWSGLTPREFAQAMLKPEVTTLHNSGIFHIKCRGVANFLTLYWLNRRLDAIPAGQSVVVDLAHIKMVDFTTQEFLHDFARNYTATGGTFEILELPHHAASSGHPFSLRRAHSVLDRRAPRPNSRQEKLQWLAEKHGWEFEPTVDWSPQSQFHFFETRPVEYSENLITGRFEDLGFDWIVKDITFDIGAFTATEEHHVTVQEISIPFRIPRFAIEKASWVDRILELTGAKETDFSAVSGITNEFNIKGPEGEDLAAFFTEDRLEVLHQHGIYHLESNGDKILIFQNDRLVGASEVEAMLDFARQFVGLLETPATD